MNDQRIYQIDQILLSFVRIDEVKIKEMVSYDPSKELLTQLILIFNTEVKDNISQIKVEQKNENFSQISRIAHRLRSTSLNLGATRLSEILKRIEYLTLETEVLARELDLLINAAEKESQFASETLPLYLK